MGLSADEQEAFTLGKIEENFSNYSAWHERTRVLQQLNTERPTLSLAELLATDSTKTSTPAQGVCNLAVVLINVCIYSMTGCV